MLSQFYFETASFFLNQVTEGLPDNQHLQTNLSAKFVLNFKARGIQPLFVSHVPCNFLFRFQLIR